MRLAASGSIVVGTDGSDRAERAVHRAGQLAKLIGAKVHVVSAYAATGSEAPWPATSAKGLHVPDLPADAGGRGRAQHNVDRAQQSLGSLGVDSETHLWPGDPAEALLRIAGQHEAQMIIVGNRGMTGARRLLGSVPNHISHHAPCDVLIVATE